MSLAVLSCCEMTRVPSDPLVWVWICQYVEGRNEIRNPEDIFFVGCDSPDGGGRGNEKRNKRHRIHSTHHL